MPFDPEPDGGRPEPTPFWKEMQGQVQLPKSKHRKARKQRKKRKGRK